MAIDQERVKTHIIGSSVDGDILKVSAVPHIITESEESRRKNRDVLADRATIAGAAERGFIGRMWYGLTETYQRLRRRDALQRFHDDGEDVRLGSAAFEQAKDRVREMVAQERDEITATAISRNINYDIGEEDATMVLDEETAGSERQEEIVTWARIIVSEYASGEIDRDRMQELSENLSCELRDELPELFSETTIGSDLVYIAEAARDAYVANEEKIKAIDLDLQICFGRVETGMATEERRDFADRVVDWAQGGRVRAVLVNPLTVGATASAVAVGAKAPFRAIPVVGGIAGGAFAAVRRWSKENKDRDLRVREEEIGYEIPQPAQHVGVERVLSGLVGQTDFREVSYQPRSALEMTEEFNQMAGADVAEKQTQVWQDDAVESLAQASVRLGLSEEYGVGLIQYGQRRGEGGRTEITGVATINQDRLAMILAAQDVQRQLVDQIGDNEFNNRFLVAAERIGRQVDEERNEANSRFSRSRLLMSLRSGTFGFGVGVLGGLGIHEIGEGIEHVSRKVADVFHQAHEQRMVPDQKDVSLGHGNIINADGTTLSHQGLQVDVASGINAHLDAAKHTLSVDVPANGADAAKHFEIAYQPGMTQDQIHAALVKAGLEGKVDILHSGIDVPSHLSTEDVLKSDYLAQHHLVDVTNQPHGIDFGHAQFLGDRHEYNELTLYQHDATHWSMGPHGLDGLPIKPFVYKSEGPWADPSIVSNAPVNPDSLVAFYQITDAHGQLHTILAPQTGGHFTLPQEFVDPATGKVDGVSIIGYGMVKDAHGKLIDGNQVIAHPELMNGATLHSMASIPLEQKGHMIAGSHVDLSTVKISDLTAHMPGSHPEVFDVPNKFIFDIPPIATPFAPRLFPEIVEPKKKEDEFIPVYVPGNYLRTSEEMRQEIRQNLSQHLKDNPEAILDSKREMEAYISRQPKEWRRKINSKVRSIAPMEPGVRAVIAIPVASHQEGDNIYNTLLHYAKQVDAQGNAMNSQFELILNLNRPRNSKPDKTASEVRRFQNDHPEVKVRVINSVFSQKEPIGKIRKLITDVAVARALKSGVAEQDLIIVSNDADAIDVSEKYASSMIETFDRDQSRHVDAVLGKIEWWDEVLKKYPTFYAANRFMQYLDSTLRHAPEGERHIASSGANFAFRASTYSAVGGYNPDFIGEDVVLGTKIKVARAGNATMIPVERYPIKFSNRSRISTNPRRGLAKYLEGKAVVEQWDDFDKSDYVRDLNIDEFAARSPEEFDVKRLQAEVNATIAAYRLAPDVDVVRRSLDFLKISWHAEGEKVIIDDASRLEASFKRFADLVVSQAHILDSDDGEPGNNHTGNQNEESHAHDADVKRTFNAWMDEYLVKKAKDMDEAARSEGRVDRYKAKGRIKGDRLVALPMVARGIARRKYTKDEFNRIMEGTSIEMVPDNSERFGMSRGEIEKAAKDAAEKSSAEQVKRPFNEWIAIFEAAKQLGLQVEDLDDFDDDDLLKLLPKNPTKRLDESHRKKITKHGAVRAIVEIKAKGKQQAA